MSDEQKTTVLVVDDELVIRDLCSHALKEYRVLQAGSLREALDLYQAEQVDLVLTDVMMPGGSGIELLRQVKALDPSAVVVVMTGFGDKEIILNALKEDADDFINKPLQLLQLRTSVQKVLGKKALKEELATLKRLDSLKGSFLALISHKLKTPITSLSLGLEELQRYAAQFNPESECHDRIHSMREDLQFLTRLVTSLLRFNQVMIPSVNRYNCSCDLADVVRAAAATAAQTANRPLVRLELDSIPSLPGFKCDCERVQFAIQQVIDNAFKFTEDGGVVTISLSRQRNRALVTVADTGCGIPQEEMHKIFERFYQVDPDATGQVPGFGLGLFCAREIARQHGGTIGIVSEPGQGTVVTITLKCVEERTDREAADR